MPEDIIKSKAYRDLVLGFYNPLSTSLSSVSADVMPGAMHQVLSKDVFNFSVVKSNAAMQQAFGLLLDENGKPKPFNSFLNDVKKVFKKYDENYLQAEYEFAVQSAQLAARWESFSDDSDYALQYRTAKDDKVRSSHRELDETTLRKSDPFWKEFFPPNGWRCRCTTVEVIADESELSDSEKAKQKGELATTRVSSDGVNKMEIFRFNPGAELKAFPPKHPYHKIPGSNEALEVTSKLIPDEIFSYERELGVTINKEIFLKLKQFTPLLNVGEKASYNFRKKVVNIPRETSGRKDSKWKAASTIYHEYGHAIDYQYDLILHKKANEIMDRFRAEFSKNNDKLFSKLNKECWEKGERYLKQGKKDMMHQVGALHDTLMSLNPMYGEGHSMAYWQLPGRKEAEFIAHAFENYFLGNSQFKAMAPQLYKESIKLIDDFFKQD